MLSLAFIGNWLSDVPAHAVPYALAALGLIVAERAGVLSLTAEGLMLVGALSGIASYIILDGHPIVALLIAMVAAGIVSTLFAFVVVYLRVNQVIAGLATVFFCQGLTNLVGTLAGWTNHPVQGLQSVQLGWLSQMPILGRIFFCQDMVIYGSIFIFAGVSWLLMDTGLGLRLRSVGEAPEAADAAGINVSLYRFGAVVAGSMLIGLAGGYLSVVNTKIWIPNMTDGHGWISVALVIFARWQPLRALGGALLFGGVEAVIPHIAAAGIPAPQYFVLMTPYAVTLAVMLWAEGSKSWTAAEPAALGQAYVREERR
jgi:general nucleoside transport system permease protein